MYLISEKPGNFGAGDLLACKHCDGTMLLTRRSPHPTLGPKYEEQVFTCTKCNREVMRDADEEGKPSTGA